MATYTVRQLTSPEPPAPTPALVTTGQSLVAIDDWTFLFGPATVRQEPAAATI